MTEDTFKKTDWKEVFSYYRRWNKADLQGKLRDAGKKGPDQKWQEFLSIMEFGMMIRPNPSKHEQRQEIRTQNRYYQRIQRFEKWRQDHGKSFHAGITP